MTTASTELDLVIVGAGPAGLALARALGDSGLAIALVERQAAAALAAPAFDGREIALTRRSVELLRGLDAWDRLPAAEIAPLGEARVLNGGSARALRFQPEGGGSEPLGHLVPNHLIRRALHEAVAACPAIRLLADSAAGGIETGRSGARLTLADGRRLSARLIVAADTRFSELRRRMGIAATLRDFGRTMLVCRLAHEAPHGAVATEWFGYGQTVALLPLNGDAAAPHRSSLVLTLPARQIERLMALAPEPFAAEVTQRLERRLGAMRLASTRHAYPLVAAYAERFVAERFALVGDAAVGMHPVTAHGFNFGLAGAHRLASLVAEAAAAGRDIADPALLRRYETQHRLATHPLYLATNTTARLYTDDRLPARLLRDAVIRAGAQLAPLRRAVVAQLMKAAEPPQKLLNDRSA